MTLIRTTDSNRTLGQSPTDRMLTASLVVAPLLYLVADTIYAVDGWTSATAGVIHVLGAIAYGLVVLRVAGWLPDQSVLSAVLVLTALGLATTHDLALTAIAGSVGNAAYGFDTIHQSLGDTSLVDQTGAATLIKPLGLIFPLSMALVALGLRQLGRPLPAVLVLLGALGWPAAHIGNLGALAVLVNVLLVVAFGMVAWGSRPTATGTDIGATGHQSL